MFFEYSSKLMTLLEQVEQVNKEAIATLANEFARCIKEDKIIHLFGTGHSHMMGVELFARAGGLGNIDPLLDPCTLTSFGAQRAGKMEQTCGVSDVIYDAYQFEKGDVMIVTSNSGRNAMPIEMAKRCHEEGIYVVALTSYQQSKASTSRHPSGKKLYDYADLVLDTCVPRGDVLVNIEGIKTGSASSIVSMFLLDLIVSEAIRISMAQGVRPYVFQSQNVDGFNNDDIYAKFASRIKHY